VSINREDEDFLPVLPPWYKEERDGIISSSMDLRSHGTVSVLKLEKNKMLLYFSK